MDIQNLESLKYPIGKYSKLEDVSEAQIQEWIATIEGLPQILGNITKDLTIEQLSWPYRPGGWTIKQVVHHCADSHMNSMIRFKLTLTEDSPTIKPYYEDRWANLIDSNDDDLSHTLSLLKGLHAKWVLLLRSMTKDELEREFIHPEHGKHFSLEETIGLYAWHCKHHVAHIKQALKYKGNFNK